MVSESKHFPDAQTVSRTTPPPLPAWAGKHFLIRWRQLRCGETDHELIWLFVSLTTAALAFFWLHSGLPWPKCPWHALTGFACPTCGGTRCALHFANGELLRALHFNPMVFFGFCGLIVFDLYAFIVLVFRLPRFRIDHVSSRAARWTRVIIVSGVLLNWAYLIHAGI